MTDLRARDNRLNWDLFVTPGIPVVTSHKMLKLYSDRVNPGALWLSARGVKP